MQHPDWLLRVTSKAIDEFEEIIKPVVAISIPDLHAYENSDFSAFILNQFIEKDFIAAVYFTTKKGLLKINHSFWNPVKTKMCV